MTISHGRSRVLLGSSLRRGGFSKLGWDLIVSVLRAGLSLELLSNLGQPTAPDDPRTVQGLVIPLPHGPDSVHVLEA